MVLLLYNSFKWQYMARELEPEPKLWTKVELEAEPNINNFGSATHTKKQNEQI